jgi:hypothetical protein
VRAALEEAVKCHSLRNVARETRMSPTGLQGVLGGTTPYGKTWEKLRVWYARGSSDPHRTLIASAVAEVLQMMLREVPDGGRGRAIDRVLQAIEAAHAEAGVPFPAWLIEVRTMTQEEAASGADLVPAQGE